LAGATPHLRAWAAPRALVHPGRAASQGDNDGGKFEKKLFLNKLFY
jgi:hypothetical protein